jgi:hypothetical protein
MRNLAQLTGHSDDMTFPSVAQAYTPGLVGAVSSTPQQPAEGAIAMRVAMVDVERLCGYCTSAESLL